MINVIVPVVENVERFSEFLKSSVRAGVKFYVGVRKSLAESLEKGVKLPKGAKSEKGSKSVEMHVFSDSASKEEIVNSLHSCKMKKGKILIVRRPLTAKEWENLSTSTSDITTLKAKHNKFVTAMKKFGRMIVQRFFAFSFFEDISAICYGENMFELMSVCANLSMASRVNKYVGVEISEIETDEKPAQREFSRLKTALVFALWTILMIGSVVGGVLVCALTKISAISVLLVILWMVVAIMLWLVALINFTRTLAVGKLRYGRAEEMK